MVKITKKGFVITIGIFLLGLTLLSYSMLHKDLKSAFDETTTELIMLERVRLIDSAVQAGFRKIFLTSSNLEVNLTNEYIMFSEDLPTKQEKKLQVDLQDFASYVETQYPEVDVNLGNFLEKRSLVIKPYNIVYQHNPWGGNTLEVIPETINFNKYLLSIQTGAAITSCEYTTPTGNQSLAIQLIVDAKGLEQNCNFSGYVDPYQDNEFNFNNKKIYITLKDGGKLSVSNSQAYIKIDTSIYLNQLDQLPYVTFPSDFFKINLATAEKESTIDITKESGVQIA